MKYKAYIDTYSMFWESTLGFKIKPTKQFYARQGKTYKELTEHFTEGQIKLLIALHFDWKGVDDNDEKQLEWNKKCAFPPEWIIKKCSEYEMYLRKVVDFDDEEKVGEFYNKWIRNLQSNS